MIKRLYDVLKSINMYKLIVRRPKHAHNNQSFNKKYQKNFKNSQYMCITINVQNE